YGADRGIKADLRKGRIDKGVRVDRVRSIGDVIGTEEPDVLRGSRGGNKLVGSSGDDRIYGRGGGDCLGGANGTNELFGGAGFDHYASSWLDCFKDRRSSSDVTYWPTTAINVDLLQGRGWRVGEVSNLTSIEGAYGTFDADNLLGDDKANEFYGGPGRDEIAGGAGDDFLDGGQETDTLNGGLGGDACVNGEVNIACE
ncbi:MAG: hypothetical protein M3217_06650, partial [Actinomycetota bacterium]|nr:hypothetical protein [Actinomycetota bacterium]